MGWWGVAKVRPRREAFSVRGRSHLVGSAAVLRRDGTAPKCRRFQMPLTEKASLHGLFIGNRDKTNSPFLEYGANV